MLHKFRDKIRRRQEAQERARQERERRERERLQDAERQKRAEQERVQKILSIRVITGEVKYRHAVIDTVRAVGFYEVEPDNRYLPDEATNRAIAQIQEHAYRLGADAVIHAQYHILRYSVQRRQHVNTIYETHVFGTAIKILGPPSDWTRDKDESF